MVGQVDSTQTIPVENLESSWRGPNEKFLREHTLLIKVLPRMTHLAQENVEPGRQFRLRAPGGRQRIEKFRSNAFLIRGIYVEP